MAPGVLEEFQAETVKIFGEDLVSLTVYGSHAGENPGAGARISVLVVVRELRKEAFSSFRGIAHRYARRGIPPPPIFTEAFLANSADVFPLEFLGMRSMRRVLAGRDVVAELEISTENLRHQVEFELKGKLLSLRRIYMGTFGNKEFLGVLADTAGPVVSAARGLLLLSNPEAPHDKREIVEDLEKRVRVRLPTIREALALKGGAKVPPSRAEELFLGYLDDVDRLCTLADSYRGEPTA